MVDNIDILLSARSLEAMPLQVLALLDEKLGHLSSKYVAAEEKEAHREGIAIVHLGEQFQAVKHKKGKKQAHLYAFLSILSPDS